jgi:hypothetical protein
VQYAFCISGCQWWFECSLQLRVHAHSEHARVSDRMTCPSNSRAATSYVFDCSETFLAGVQDQLGRRGPDCWISQHSCLGGDIDNCRVIWLDRCLKKPIGHHYSLCSSVYNLFELWQSQQYFADIDMTLQAIIMDIPQRNTKQLANRSMLFWWLDNKLVYPG